MSYDYNKNFKNRETFTEEPIPEKKDNDLSTMDGMQISFGPESKVVISYDLGSEPDKTVINEPLPEPVKGKVINCNKLNVRRSADVNSAIVLVLNKGDKVIIENVVNDWLHIYVEKDMDVSGFVGYVMSKYIDI